MQKKCKLGLFNSKKEAKMKFYPKSCPQCKKTHPAIFNFCNHCGTKLKYNSEILNVCSCEEVLSEEDKFCPFCGKKRERMNEKQQVFDEEGELIGVQG
jgi:rRNA maturation endonuclease Nob1